MAVRPMQHHRNAQPAEREPRWDPHYVGDFAEESIEVFQTSDYPWVDSRFLRTMLNSEKGIVVKLRDSNPMNAGKKVIIRRAGFFIEEGGKIIPCPFKVFSISIPTNIGKLAITFKSVRNEGPEGGFSVIQF